MVTYITVLTGKNPYRYKIKIAGHLGGKERLLVCVSEMFFSWYPHPTPVPLELNSFHSRICSVSLPGNPDGNCFFLSSDECVCVFPATLATKIYN